MSVNISVPTSAPVSECTAAPKLAPVPAHTPEYKSLPLLEGFCGDGYCDGDPGETCQNCKADCKNSFEINKCGDNIFQAGNKENNQKCRSGLKHHLHQLKS